MPTLEEIHDDEMDLEFDDADFDDFTPFANQPGSSHSSNGPARLVPTSAKKPASSTQISQEDLPPLPSGFKASEFKQFAPGQGSFNVPDGPQFLSPEHVEKFKDWEVMYPVYFNKDRSHSEGRRVPIEYAVEDPVSQTLIEALKSISIPAVLEPERTHPKDWANPGRVRYLLKDQDLAEERSKYGLPLIKTSRQLYKLVGEYLKAHPTNKDTCKRSPIYGQLKEVLYMENARLPAEKQKPGAELERSISFTPAAIPNGWEKKKIGTVLMPNSPALSFMAMDSNDLAEEMAKGMFGGLPGGGGIPGVPGAPTATGTPANMTKQKPKKVFIRR